MAPIVALTVAVIGYVGWACTAARSKSKTREMALLQEQATDAAKIIAVLTQQDRKSELSIYVLRSHLRQAQHNNENLQRQVTDQQRQLKRLEDAGNAARDKLARLKPRKDTQPSRNGA